MALGIGWWLPEPAEAQFTRYRRFEAGAFLGGMAVDHDLGTASNVFFTATGQADDVSFGTDFFGARFSFDFSPNLAAEATYSRARQTFSYHVLDDLDAGDVMLVDQFDATQQKVSGNLVVQFPLEIGLIPYGTIGFAWVRTEPGSEIAGVTSESSDGLNFGGGAKYFFPGAQWVGARFDLRYQFLSEGLAFGDQLVEPRNTEVTIGVAFRF
jgi:hypothetical protein